MKFILYSSCFIQKKLVKTSNTKLDILVIKEFTIKKNMKNIYIYTKTRNFILRPSFILTESIRLLKELF
jgi:hypothetical protein